VNIISNYTRLGVLECWGSTSGYFLQWEQDSDKKEGFFNKLGRLMDNPTVDMTRKDGDTKVG